MEAPKQQHALSQCQHVKREDTVQWQQRAEALRCTGNAERHAARRRGKGQPGFNGKGYPRRKFRKFPRTRINFFL